MDVLATAATPRPTSPKTATGAAAAPPVNPVNPVNPTNPTNPVNPVNPTNPTNPVSAEALLKAFRAAPGLEARFVESKTMALLARPLVSKGRIYYLAPGRLARYVDAPSASIALIDPGKVELFDGTRWSTIDLASKPVVQRFVSSFVVLISGDDAALHTLYTASYGLETVGEAQYWRLTLRPRTKPLNQIVRSISLWGRGLIVARMRMEEVEGDITETRFEAVNPARRFSAEEQKRLFAPPAP